MRSPYRQQRGDTAMQSFGKSLGKSAIVEGIKKLTPTAGAIANAMGQIESAASNAGNYAIGKGLTKGLGAMSGGGLASILTSPNEIANDPMEGMYGVRLRSENAYRNRDIELGNAMGPAVPAQDIRRIVDADIMDDNLKFLSAKAKKKQQLSMNDDNSSRNLADLAGLISSLAGGIR